MSPGDARRLRVGFDGRALASPAAGVRRYLAELLRALAALQADVDLVAIGAPDDVALPAGVANVRAPLRPPTNLGWTQVAVPLAARRARLDVYHAPAYTAPLWGVGPLVVTIHDASYARHPEWYPYRRDPFRMAFYRRSALAADAVITDSEFSRAEIAAAYGLSPERIAVIPLGVGKPFSPAGPAEAVSLPKGLARPFLLHVGDLHPRRNLATALAATLAVRGRRPDLRSLRLVLVGIDRGSGDGLVAQAAASGQPDVLALLGDVNDDSLVELYRGAAALIYPSRYEGFGLPLIEAMACGTPIVAARAGSIPEVVGDAGLLIDPDDGRGFADAIEAVLTGTQLSGTLRGLAIERAASFTWSEAAARTLDVYRRAAAAGVPQAAHGWATR